MSEFQPQPVIEQAPAKNRKIIDKEKWTVIYDPRIKAYAGNSELHQKISPFCGDQGAEWIVIDSTKLQEVIDILDSYPEKPEDVE